MEQKDILETIDEWSKEEVQKKRAELIEYMNTVFSVSERTKHGDNIINMLCDNGSVACLKLKFLVKG